jgi:DNA polymerase-4
LARHECYVEFHHRLIEEIGRHIPVSAVCSIDEVACRLMDNENSPERSAEIAQSIKNGIANKAGPYLRCSIGIAPNRYLAKVGTELEKPDGLVVLNAADLPQRLFSLKLRDLPGVGANIEQRIKQAGIVDIQGLFALNPHQTRKIWGSIWGEKAWYLMRGMELPEETTTRRSIGHSHVMAPALRSDQGQGCGAALDAEGCQPPAPDGVLRGCDVVCEPSWKTICRFMPKIAFTGRKTIKLSWIS